MGGAASPPKRHPIKLCTEIHKIGRSWDISHRRSLENVKSNEMNVFRLLGWKLQTLRRLKGLTQEELASRIGAAEQGYISDLELGKGNPTLLTVFRISEALNTPLSELLSTENVPAAVLNEPMRQHLPKDVLE